MKLGNLLTSKASPTTIAQAAAIFPEIKLPYANYAGSIAQMLKAFPQYSSVSDLWGAVGNSHYNSLQLTANKTLSHGLVVNMNYTFAKAFDDLASRSSYWSEKAQTTDSPQILNAIWLYRLPFGKGHKFAAGNAVVERITGNWQLSGITTYRKGGGIGSIGASCNLPSAGSCYADLNPNFSGPVRINGDYGSGDLLGSNPPAYLDKNAFLNPAAYTYGTSPRTMVDKIHFPSTWNQNVSLKRDFRLRESWMLTVQMDASNVFNTVIFANPATSISSTSFGKITAQGNSPRVVQFNARVTF
jgi:hypothetical protein